MNAPRSTAADAELVIARGDLVVDLAPAVDLVADVATHPLTRRDVEDMAEVANERCDGHRVLGIHQIVRDADAERDRRNITGFEFGIQHAGDTRDPLIRWLGQSQP